MYRVGIVGCGRIASTYDDDPLRKFVSSHAGAYTAVPKTELVAAADIDQNKLSKFGKRWNVKSLYSDYKKMLKKENIDILSVCTWNSTHYEIVKEAVKVGVKAIFCEKPISDTLSQADEMIRLCRKNNIILAVDHQRRWDKFHEKIKKIVNDEQLGNIQQVTFYYTGGIANVGTHMFDLLRYFFGDAKWIWSVYNGDENVDDPKIDGYLYFKNGTHAIIQSCDAKHFMIFEMDILGTRGRFKITNNGFNGEFFKVDKSKLFSGYKELSRGELPFKPGKKEMLIWAVEDIVNCIETGKDPFCTGEDGRAALELICAFHESAQQGGVIINLPLKKRDLKIKSIV